MTTKKPKTQRKPRASLYDPEQVKQKKYRKELARMVYHKHRIEPPSDELGYEGRATGFLIIPDEFIYAGDHLSHGEKMTWLAIFKHNWAPDPTYRVSWPGRETLGVIIGASVRQVTRYLQGLREKGLLLSRRRLDKTSLHVLKDPPRTWMNDTLRKLKRLEQIEEAEQKDLSSTGRM